MVEWIRTLATLVLSSALAFGSFAKEAEPVAQERAVEVRMLRLATELRCLVCQNQTLADSHAGLAVDLREQLRTMMRGGDSDEQVLAYMAARYGDFVLYRPPVKATTWLLWIGPGVLLLGGLAALGWVIRKRQRLPNDAFELDPDAETP